jgi:GTP-binding protein
MRPIIAIVGRPNVGKSTLFNRIVGGRTAITLDVSGVTRDRHYGTSVWEGKEFICVDTGGLFLDDVGPLEKKVREQVELAISEATAILMVLDGRQGILPEEMEIANYLRRAGKKVFFVINKIDDQDQEERLNEFYSLGRELHPVSAEHGYRVNDLLDAVIATFPPAAKEEKKEKAIRVALVGRPNVGKSSLLNRLLGEERAVVHNEPGTTRDVVDTPIKIGGTDYLILDTAGIRRKGKWSSKVERYSVLNALKAVERADVCLMLLDATEGIHKQDAHVVGYINDAKKGMLILWNKWDLVKNGHWDKTRKKFDVETREELRFVTYAPMLFISAATGIGCDKIWPKVAELYKSCGRRISTSQVNKTFEKLIGSHNPPVYKGKPVKFFYATQVNTFPPTFIIFVNEPEGVHFSFQRYLLNGFRDNLDFGGAPLQIHFRKKK